MTGPDASSNAETRLDLVGGALTRAPQPIARYGLPSAVSAQLEALTIAPDRPLLAVDADEVLLEFAAPLARFVETKGWRMALTGYRLQGAITRAEDGTPAEPNDVRLLIQEFFAAEAANQRVAPDAAAALRRLETETGAAIVVVTNVPLAQRETRIDGLKRQGVDYPLVANSGGKGRALRYLWDRTTGPVAFIDDSDQQLASVARFAPDVIRAHFIADPSLRALAEASPNAHFHSENWPALAGSIAERFAGRAD